jgi:pSer/pThr/pTyr-binding forkhead associated (FHA) protein
LFVVGRALDCDLVLPSSSVAQHHARLLVSTDEILLLSLGPTRIDGAPVWRGEERRIAEGARLQFGRFELVVCSAGTVWERIHET